MKNDLICFSHLRWNFVYQRPQHLMSRAGKESRIFYIEEPEFTKRADRLSVNVDPEHQVIVVTPELKRDPPEDKDALQLTVEMRMAALVDQLILQNGITDYVTWYYAPMAIAFTEHLKPKAIVYDCMDELSLFRGAPARLRENEVEPEKAHHQQKFPEILEVYAKQVFLKVQKLS